MYLAGLNLADWIILVVLACFVISAIFAGFFREAFGIAGLVVGYMLAAWQYQHVASLFSSYVRSMWVADIASFLVIFLAVMVVAGIAGRLAHWAMKKVGLSGLDRAFGAVLGLVRGVMTVAVVLVSIATFKPSSSWLQGSQLAPYFLVVGRAATWAAPAELRSQFYRGLDLLRREADKTAMPGVLPAHSASGR